VADGSFQIKFEENVEMWKCGNVEMEKCSRLIMNKYHVEKGNLNVR